VRGGDLRRRDRLHHRHLPGRHLPACGRPQFGPHRLPRRPVLHHSPGLRRRPGLRHGRAMRGLVEGRPLQGEAPLRGRVLRLRVRAARQGPRWACPPGLRRRRLRRRGFLQASGPARSLRRQGQRLRRPGRRADILHRRTWVCLHFGSMPVQAGEPVRGRLRRQGQRPPELRRLRRRLQARGLLRPGDLRLHRRHRGLRQRLLRHQQRPPELRWLRQGMHRGNDVQGRRLRLQGGRSPVRRRLHRHPRQPRKLRRLRQGVSPKRRVLGRDVPVPRRQAQPLPRAACCQMRGPRLQRGGLRRLRRRLPHDLQRRQVLPGEAELRGAPEDLRGTDRDGRLLRDRCDTGGSLPHGPRAGCGRLRLRQQLRGPGACCRSSGLRPGPLRSHRRPLPQVRRRLRRFPADPGRRRGGAPPGRRQRMAERMVRQFAGDSRRSGDLPPVQRVPDVDGQRGSERSQTPQLRELVRGVRLLHLGRRTPTDGSGVGVRGGGRERQPSLPVGKLRA
jgi:hypothetical protein